MPRVPACIQEFLDGRRYAVAGVSRDAKQPANAIYRRLREAGFEVAATNPRTSEVEGDPCYPDLGSVPGHLDGVVIATTPDAAAEVIRAAAERGVKRVWMHRSFGKGSVSPEAARWGREQGMQVIEGGCPMMFCEPVDPAHRCIGWLMKVTGGIRA